MTCISNLGVKNITIGLLIILLTMAGLTYQQSRDKSKRTEDPDDAFVKSTNPRQSLLHSGIVSTTVREPSSPQMVTRHERVAHGSVGAMKLQDITNASIHHTAERKRSSISLVINKRGLQDILQLPHKFLTDKVEPVRPGTPYQYYIKYDGSISEGRAIEYADVTYTLYDTNGHAQIVLIEQSTYV